MWWPRPMDEPIRIVIADDHAIVVDGLRTRFNPSNPVSSAFYPIRIESLRCATLPLCAGSGILIRIISQPHSRRFCARAFSVESETMTT